MKIILTGLLTTAIIALSSCSNTQKPEKGTAMDSTTQQHSGEHVYACPMHPEVTGKEGDECSKCGMPLEHNDNAGKGNGNTYKMKFESRPSPVEAGRTSILSLTPQIAGRENEPVPLDIEHGKKIHFIMVSDDLSWFDHQHPEYASTGSYDLPYTFTSGGRYILFADYKPSGSNHALEKINIEVKGKTAPAKTYKEERLVSRTGEFEITLSPAEGGKFKAGSLQHITGVITKNGKAVDAGSLENYLGAKAHMVIIGMDDKNYLHVHPGVENGKFDLHATFVKPGIYRGWIQFQSAGKIYTADFVFRIDEGIEIHEVAPDKMM
jgi:hypothetical protein